MHLPDIPPNAPPKTAEDLREEKAAAQRVIQQWRFCPQCGSCLIAERRNDDDEDSQSPPPQRKRIIKYQPAPPQRKTGEEEVSRKKKKNSEIKINPASVLADSFVH